MALTFNGKPFDPEDFKEALLQGIRAGAADHVQAAVGAIRDPVTGEFPTIVTSTSDAGEIALRIEGSPEMLALVEQRLPGKEGDTGMASESERAHEAPKVFLSYSSGDRPLAERIARALQEAGIETWWDGWSISAGDSLPQKINEGIGGCTHFVVLLTPSSVQKPWVQHEMDAGLVRRISAQAKFIPLRHQLPAQDLPPLLRPMLSPEVNDIPGDVAQLINDIHGISRRPPLGRAPAARTVPRHDGYSDAANAVAKAFVEGSVDGSFADPQLDLDALVAQTQLTRDDVVDAAHELSDVLETHVYGGGIVPLYAPKAELFVRFDATFREWSPPDDALRLAADLLNDSSFPSDVAAIAERYGWPARRLNPALAYLTGRNLVHAFAGIGHPPWAALSIHATDDTRRFVRSRTR